MPSISDTTRLLLGIIAAVAGIVTGIIGNVLAINILRFFTKKRGGRKPTERPWYIWAIFYVSAATSVVLGSVAAFAPAKLEATNTTPTVTSSNTNNEFEYVGRVIDANTLQPIANAKITLTLEGVPPIVYTDNEGVYRFNIELNSSGNGQVIVEAEGYQKYIRNITLSTSTKIIEDIRLTPNITAQATIIPTLTFTPAPTIEISSQDGMELLPVLEGTFVMGVNVGDIDERPGHSVYLNTYWIDKTEVTIKMFSHFVTKAGYRTLAEMNGYGYVWRNKKWNTLPHANWQDANGDGLPDSINLPVTQVSWQDAAAYCRWAGRRLPTEAEWEKAARGVDGRTFPWGNITPNPSLASFNQKTGPSKVGSYTNGASPYGALDMAGNVWEWTADWYNANYYETSPLNNPTGPPFGTHRVLRGGGWDSSSNNIRTTNRDVSEPQYYNDTLGFRCAK